MGSSYSKDKESTEKNSDALRIGILGTADIAPDGVIDPARQLKTCLVSAVASREKSKAESYAKKHNISKTFGSYEELINSDEVDVVYNALPNGCHARYTILSLEKGKHVLCEKPFASNEEEVRLVQAALDRAPNNKRTGIKPLVLEAFHYRFHPLMRRINKLLENKELGDVVTTKTKFMMGFYQHSKHNIRYNNDNKQDELAGGVLMDGGSYAINLARLIVDADFKQKTCPQFKILDVSMKDAFDDKLIDETTKATIEFSNEDGTRTIKSEIESTFNAWRFSSTCEIEGTRQKLILDNFFAPNKKHSVTIQNISTGKKTDFSEHGDGKTTYYFQLKHFIDAINGNEDSKRLCEYGGSIESARQNMKIIDEIYKYTAFQPRVGYDPISPIQDMLKEENDVSLDVNFKQKDQYPFRK